MPKKDKYKLTSKDMPRLELDGGVIYTGPVKAGVPHTAEGQEGILQMPNGDVYTGEFKQGKRYGHGVRKNKDGS